jgi:hypothetical protein
MGICNFCLSIDGDAINCLLCFINLSMVTSLYRFHSSDGISCIFGYLYGLFWCSIGSVLLL